MLISNQGKHLMNSKIINRLTALWALAESGLGGYMHALKIPFTGIFVGGSAILIISLIAYFSNGSFKAILRSTLLVLLVKFAVSPHTSMPAYVAVAFQGVVGALLLSIPLSRIITIPLFFVIAMLESALQKFLMSTVLFGMDLWKSLDESAIKMARELGLGGDWASHFTLKIILIYCLLYFVWAILLSLFAIRLPHLLQSRSEEILSQYRNTEHSSKTENQLKKKKSRNRLIVFLSILLFMSMAYFVNYNSDEAWLKAGILLIRTVFILLVYFTLITPIIKKLLEYLSKKKGNTKEINSLIEELTEIRTLLPIAWRLSEPKKSALLRFPYFILNLIVLSLYLENHDKDTTV